MSFDKASASWDENLVQTLINCVLKQVSLGMMYFNRLKIGKSADIGLKKEAWTAIINEFNKSTGNVELKKGQLQTKLGWLKKKFLVFKKLKEQSGFGWCEETNRPTAPKEVIYIYIRRSTIMTMIVRITFEWLLISTNIARMRRHSLS